MPDTGTYYTQDDCLTLLAAAIEQAGGVRAFSRANGLSPSLVSRATNMGHLGPRLLAVLRIARVVRYRRLRRGEASHA